MTRRIELYSDYIFNPEYRTPTPMVDIFNDVNQSVRFAEPKEPIIAVLTSAFKEAGHAASELNFEQFFDNILQDLQKVQQAQGQQTQDKPEIKSIVIDLDTIEPNHLSALRQALKDTYGYKRAQTFGVGLQFYFASSAPQKLSKLPGYIHPFVLSESLREESNLRSAVNALINAEPLPNLQEGSDNIIQMPFSGAPNSSNGP